MKDKRRFKRFNLDIIEINGKMSLTDKVRILDISLGGLAIKADRRLNIGREYIVKLQDKGKTIDVKGTVVRAELSGTEQKSNGETVSIYTAGLVFKEGYAEKIAEFLKPLEQNKIIEAQPTSGLLDSEHTIMTAEQDKPKETPSAPNRRIHVRFNIITPQEKTLSYPLEFRVKQISLSGMLIETEQAVLLNSAIPMELSLDEEKTITFIGRVASSNRTENTGKSQYALGVQFTNLAEKDKMLIDEFIAYLAENEAKNNGEKTDT
jgi:c-di-GMP-binding flagellar brake protein YcgR